MVNYGDCIVFLLAKAYQQAHLHLKKHLLPYGLTPVQYLVLEAISREEGLSATEIGRKVSLDSATLSGILDRLTERQWIIKELDTQDRRSLRLYPGEKAKASRDELVGVRERSNAEILEDFSLEERIILKRLLKDLSRHALGDRSI
ncbi:MAG: MarR family transcriptional regulator [Pseudomonadota bacterium]